MDLVNKQINISEIVLFKQNKITCFDMQYVQIKSCIPTFHIDNKSIDGRERKEEIEGTKGVIRIRKQKGRQPNDQGKNVQRDKQRSTKIYRKLMIEKHAPL